MSSERPVSSPVPSDDVSSGEMIRAQRAQAEDDGYQPERQAHVPRKKPISRIMYQGVGREIMGLHIVNVLLSIITLGIYSFWGKTRIRRYMSAHLVLGKDRFRYTGTGKELFIGWLKAMLIFSPVMAGLGIPVINLFVYPIFFGVLAVAGFLAMRYRLSRTQWRGISFTMGGHAGHYLWLSIKRSVINFLTLGFAIPRTDILKWSYMANHMRYGEQEFVYEGDPKKIFQIHVLTIVFVMILYTVWAFYLGYHINDLEALKVLDQKDTASMSKEELERLNDAAQVAIMGVLIPLYGIIGLSMLARVWYQAALWREKFRGLKVGELRFKLDVTGGQLALLQITNLLIVIVSLGIASPLTTHRTIRFFTKKLRIGGDVNSLVVKQNIRKGPTGFGDAIAADVGFDLGL